MKKPEYITVCWRCKRGGVQLWKCDNGTDYICAEHKQWYGLKFPETEIGNQSKVYLNKSLKQ